MFYLFINYTLKQKLKTFIKIILIFFIIVSVEEYIIIIYIRKLYFWVLWNSLKTRVYTDQNFHNNVTNYEWFTNKFNLMKEIRMCIRLFLNKFSNFFFLIYSPFRLFYRNMYIFSLNLKQTKMSNLKFEPMKLKYLR